MIGFKMPFYQDVQKVSPSFSHWAVTLSILYTSCKSVMIWYVWVVKLYVVWRNMYDQHFILLTPLDCLQSKVMWSLRITLDFMCMHQVYSLFTVHDMNKLWIKSLCHYRSQAINAQKRTCLGCVWGRSSGWSQEDTNNLHGSLPWLIRLSDD